MIDDRYVIQERDDNRLIDELHYWITYHNEHDLPKNDPEYVSAVILKSYFRNRITNLHFYITEGDLEYCEPQSLKTWIMRQKFSTDDADILYENASKFLTKFA